jgi:hypothetical protein
MSVQAPVAIVDLEEHRVTLHPNCPEVVLAKGVVVSVGIIEARNRILDEEQEVEAERLQPWCDHDRAADPVLAKLVLRARTRSCAVVADAATVSSFQISGET